jgi:hypothetical protein
MTPTPNAAPNDIVARFAATQLPAVQAQVLQHVTEQIPDLNANLKSAYLTTFNNWLINWTAGRITDKSTAPVPPNGYVVGSFLDPTSGPGTIGPYGETPIYWAYPEIGKEPVCAQPPIPTIPPVYVPDPNAQPPGELGEKTNAVNPASDGFPVGVKNDQGVYEPIATSANGSEWVKFVAHTPWGTTWYWECVKAAVSA